METGALRRASIPCKVYQNLKLYCYKIQLFKQMFQYNIPILCFINLGLMFKTKRNKQNSTTKKKILFLFFNIPVRKFSNILLNDSILFTIIDIVFKVFYLQNNSIFSFVFSFGSQFINSTKFTAYDMPKLRSGLNSTLKNQEFI